MPHLLQPDSPGVFFSTATMAAPLGSNHCRIIIAIDLSNESAYTIRSAVANYLLSRDDDAAEAVACMMEADLDAFTTSVVDILAKNLNDVRIPYKIHIMKDHDMKEKLCLEVERLGLSAVIMGSKGFGTAR
ncbi:hypothetical protein GUJ93_ZPchr0005g16353 [Zizania palustris]|uniref:UspA domain-containing protein n=1 Tax=Zizania palustris TaxID=103762 RepID=A0A8J5SCI7_ZIZPA|nr:hypothetical protein GUJ93_ZPchr0005g16353 [Zizania palustris]